MTLLKFNDPAPDLETQTSDGQPIRLSSLWDGKVLVLAFSRHFGCPQCKELFDELFQARDDLARAGLSLAIVTQADPEAAAIFCEERAPGILCLADPERQVYAAFGLGRGTVRQTLLSPAVWRSNARLKRAKGWNTDLPPRGQDAFQMGGLFIIGPDGRVRLPYYYDDIADHPPVDLILHGVMGADWGKPLDSPIEPGPAS